MKKELTLKTSALTAAELTVVPGTPPEGRIEELVIAEGNKEAMTTVDQAGGSSTWHEYARQDGGGAAPESQIGSLALPLKRMTSSKKNGHGVRNAAFAAITVVTAALPLTGAFNAAYGAQLTQPAAVASATVNQQQSSQALHVSSLRNLIDTWAPHQHVYVVGDSISMGPTKISNAQLDELERWADQHAPNATIVLLQRAESSVSQDKRVLGDGLSSLPGFSQIADQRTGERTGVVLVVSLNEKAHDLKAAAGLDARGLGEANYKSPNLDHPTKLDAPFIKAMRGGDGLVVAVENTLANINSQYETLLTQETQQREAQLTSARGAITSTTGTLAMLEQKAIAFRAAHGGVSGDLATPDITQMRAGLANAEGKLKAGDVGGARSLAEQIKQKASAHLSALDAYALAPKAFGEIQAQIDLAAKHPFADAAKTEIGQARDALGKAETAYKLGNASYAGQIDQARTASAQALSTAESAESAHTRNLALGGGVAFALLAGLVALGAIRHQKAKEKRPEALKLLADWEAALNGRMDEILGDPREGKTGLHEDVRLAVGTSEGASTRYTDETRTLALQLVQDADNLMIMLGAARSVLQQAERLVEGSPLKNFFSSGNYEAAIELLRDKPIQWKPEDGLSLVLGAERSRKNLLAGDLEVYSGFTRTFRELMDSTEPGKEGFNVRAARALETLGTLNDAKQTVTQQLSQAQAQIDVAKEKAAQLAAGGAQDKLFLVPSLSSRVLASAEDALTSAQRDLAKNPVGVKAGPGAEALRRATEADALASLLADVRRELLPQLDSAKKALSEGGLDTAWIGRDLKTLSDRAETAAAGPALDKEIAALAEAFQALGSRAARAVELDQARRGKLQESVDSTTKLIATARESLGKRIGKGADEMLREAGSDPSEMLKRAAGESGAAKAALDRGDVTAAGRALGSADELIRSAAGVVERTRQAAEQFQSQATARKARTATLETTVPEHQSILDQIRIGWAPSVLTLGNGDKAHPNANGTVADNIEEANAAIHGAKDATTRAEAAYAGGRFLEGAALLAAAEGSQAMAEHRLQELAAKQSRLAATDAENKQQLARLEKRVNDLESVIADARTQGPTITAFDAAKKVVAEARGALQAGKRDPFAAGETLGRAGQALDRVKVMADNDRDIFAEAERSLQAAVAQLDRSNKLAKETANDGVADSQGIERAVKEIGALAAQLSTAQGQLKVAHGDWKALDATADRLTNDLSHVAAALVGELDRAKEATSEISRASTAVSDASTWTGSYGVVILGSPGSSDLERARRELGAGNYEGAEDYAKRAKRAADSAVSDADSQVTTRRLEEERREAEERREREEEEDRRRRASYSSSSSYSSSDSGGFGGGSSFSSSSTGGFGSSSGSSW